VRWDDGFDHTLNLLKMLREQCRAAGSPPGLFHVTRTRFEPVAQDESTDVKDHWGEFLGDTPPFGFALSELKSGRIQQSCFYGAQEKLNDYTGIAAKITSCYSLTDLPISITFDLPCANPRILRDAWTLRLYSLAFSHPFDLPLDLTGIGRNPEQERIIEPREFLGDIGRTLELERQIMEQVRARCTEEGIPKPRFIYAALAQNVFLSSIFAVDMEISRLEELARQPNFHIMSSAPPSRRAREVTVSTKNVTEPERDVPFGPPVTAHEQLRSGKPGRPTSATIAERDRIIRKLAETHNLVHKPAELLRIVQANEPIRKLGEPVTINVVGNALRSLKKRGKNPGKNSS
jgi:hypothetical protein